MRTLVALFSSLALVTPLASAQAQSLASAGGEAVVTVKKKATTYARADGTAGWSVSVAGPTTLAVGLRLPVKGAKPAVVRLIANLDGGNEQAFEVTAKPDAQAKLKGDRKAKLTQESVVAFVVPAGAHTLRVRLAPDAPAAVVVRLVSPAPPQVASTVTFSAVAPALPPPAPATPPPAPARASAAAPVTTTVPAPAVPAAALAPAVAEEIVAKEVGEGAAAPAAPASGVTESGSTLADSHPKLLGIEAGVELGVGFPQVLTKLGTGLSVGVEAGYLLPVLDQRVEVYLDGWYSQSLRRASATDARLAAGESFDFTIIEQEVLFHLGGIYRIFPPRTFINGYGLAAIYLDLQRSTVKGDASGAGFGKNRETETAVGLTLGGGAELALGPGAVAAELTFAFSDLSHRVTGNTSNGGLALALGYHLLF